MRPASKLLLLAAAALAARPPMAAAIDVAGPCDASFPPAPPGILLDALADDLDDGSSPRLEGDNHPRELRIALPNDPRAHAPLCRDANRIVRLDARRLDRCPPGHCYSCAHQQCFHLTSFECNAELSTTCVARPTPRPTIRMAETTLPVKLTLRNVPRGYQIKDEHRSSILRWVFEMLTERLVGADLTLVRVAYAGTLAGNDGNKDTVGVKGPRPDKEDKGGRRIRRIRRLRGPNAGSLRNRRLAQVDIALRVTVRGPEDESDFALSYVMEIIRAEFDDLVAYLKKNGGTVAISGVGGDVVGDASYGSGGANGGNGGGSEDSGIISVNPFDNVELGADSFNFEDVWTGPTARPTARPTREPTPSVVEEKVVVKVSGEDINVLLEDTTVTIPWWTWLVLASAILLLCLCCLCGCLWRRRRNAKKREESQQQAINIWMGADRTRENVKDGNRRKGAGEKLERNDRGSVAGTRRTSRARRPPRSIEVGDATSRRSFRSRRTSTRTSRRTSRTGGPASRRPIRRKSSTEIEEEEEREFEERLRDDAASGAAASQAHKETVKDGGDGSDGSAADRPAAAEARARDPPEELALVPYSSRLADPDGMKVSRCSSMYAADLYYSAKTLDGSNRTGGPDGSNRSESVASRAGPPKAKRQAKDSLFVCTLDELPEEVRARSRQLSEDEGPMAAEQRRQRKKKKVKGKKSRKPKKSGGDGKNDGRKRRSAVDRLRNSLKLSKVSQGHHQDIVVGAPLAEDEPSILTLPPDLRGRNELEAGFRGERSAWIRGPSRATRERGRSVESLVSDDERQRQSEADEGRGSKLAAMAKGRLSWASDTFGDDDGDDGSRGGHLMSEGSLGSDDIGL